MRLPFKRRPGARAQLIVGLGNPGKRYEASRHNVGFMAADAWAGRHGIRMERKRPWALVGEGDASLDGSTLRVIVAKPRTYMNASGEAVAEMMRRHHVRLADLIVVYDDMDLALGRIRLRAKGSAGGHRGVVSIIDRLGSQDFVRIRIGIGRPEEADVGVIDHVLGDLTAAERDAMEQAIARSADAIDEVLGKGVDAGMNRFNAG